MIYLDNGATTFPKPQAVNDKLMDVINNYAVNPGRSGHAFALKMDREIYQTRCKLTEFLGGTNEMNTIFTFNCTDSLNIAIKGVCKKGMHVITTSMEHNSVLRPLNKLKNDGIIELTIIKANELGLVDANQIIEAIKENTGLVVTTHMSNMMGAIVDVKKIGKLIKEKNEDIIYIVDGAQSLGVLEVDLEDMDIDILCFPGHKGLLGPMGTGGLYIREGIEVSTIKEGGTGSFSSDPNQPKIFPDALESGTPNGPGIIALGAGIDFIKEIGRENIHRHEMEIKDLFIEELGSTDKVKLYGPLDNRQGAVVALNIEGMDSSEVGYILNEDYQIFIRPGLHCAPLAHETLGTTSYGTVRFSFGYFNTKDEVLKAVKAVKEIAKEN